jgi:hypothetical protein
MLRQPGGGKVTAPLLHNKRGRSGLYSIGQVALQDVVAAGCSATVLNNPLKYMVLGLGPVRNDLSVERHCHAKRSLHVASADLQPAVKVDQQREHGETLQQNNLSIIAM